MVFGWLPSLLWVACLQLLLLVPVAVDARSVEFSLTADWPTWALSPLQEAAEFLTSEVEGDESLLWTLVDELETNYAHTQFDKAAKAEVFVAEELDGVWAQTLNQTSPLLHPLSHSLLHLYLSLRSYSPTLELHRSLRKGPAFDAALLADSESGCVEGVSTSWALLSTGPGEEGQVVCQAEKLAALLSSSPSPASSTTAAADEEDHRVLEFDHLYPTASGAASSSPSPLVVTLYAALGTSEFASFHSLLAPKAAAGELRYVLRHFVPAGSEASTTSTALQGYGIYLDIKNMEYTNIDDSPAAGIGAGAGAGGDAGGSEREGAIADDEDVSGVLFAKLLEREPTLTAELRQLRANLQKEAAEVANTANTNMKVWRMRDFGLQAAQTIATSKDPLRKLQELAQNFPSHASRLSSLKVTEDFREGAMAGLQVQLLGYGAQLTPGTIFINGVGRPLNTPTFNVFDILSALRDEARLLHRLDQLPVNPAARSKIVQLAAKAPKKQQQQGGEGADEVRLDIYRGSKGAIVYLNNIDKDPQYQRWPKSLQQLMYPSWQLHAIARNLYTMTLVLDLEDAASARALATMRDLYERTFPVRFSILLVSRKALEQAQMDPSLLEEAGGGDALFLDQVKAAKDGDIVGSEAVGMLFHHLREEHGMDAALGFLFSVFGDPNRKGGPRLGTYAQTVEMYSEVVGKIKGSWKGTAHVAEGWEALRGGKGAENVRLMHKLVVEKGLPVGCYLLNGLLNMGLDIEQSILQLLGAEQAKLAQMVAKGKIHDGTKSILGVILKGPSVFTRYHPSIDEQNRRNAKSVVLLGAEAKSLVSRLSYLYAPGTRQKVKPLSLILLADLGTKKGLASLQSLLAFINRSSSSSSTEVAESGDDSKDNEEPAEAIIRCAVMHNPSSSSSSAPGAWLLNHFVHFFFSKKENETAYLTILENLTKFLSTNMTPPTSNANIAEIFGAFVEELQKQEGSSEEIISTLEALASEIPTEAALKEAEETVALARKVLDVSAAEDVLVVNGRHVLLGAQPLHSLDLEVVIKMESQVFTKPLMEMLAPPAEDPEVVKAASDMIMMAHSFLNLYGQDKRTDVQAHLDRVKGTAAENLILDLHSPGGASGAGFETDPVLSNLGITILLDPLGETAQRVAPLLTILRDHLQLPLRLVLAPNPELSEFPLKSYYRFALFPTRDTRLLFQSLPTQHILTARVDTPEPWNVQTRKALQDLDNLKCDPVTKQCGDREGSTHTAAELVLKNLLIYGQCFDARLQEPVNGLQMVLLDGNNNKHHSDTMVMQNYGYFQLRADPGLWKVRLAEGRARELYEVVRVSSLPGVDLEPLPGQELVVAKRDFTHAVETLRVRKQAGKEEIPLLDEISEMEVEGGGAGGEGSGVRSSLSKVLSKGNKSSGSKAASDDDETLHVFSLATGHLYERMLKIMMLSVTKRTSMNVKFWLLENFLSPAFKTAAQAMANHYGFQVEFITYKWPDWLRQQTEKQRIIWGYKILFLDVLFPLSVKKIIYVDADQVLRADLKELWDLDLKGRPYGYTPFCDSRKETLGFQFWRSGYWANHLQGKPYHISALYVVDLQRFRRMAVGDKLRAIYDQLSRDPNSLANLDQDLPNYAQNMVPIFSLPQEWLWCESWCSDESKASAKTIDLCNNPQHKEPKLDMARRVISGSLFNESWVELDNEVKELERTVGLGV